MNCTICGLPIVLVPSARERAAKDVCGNSAAYYTSLFTTHSDCEIEKNRAEVSALMAQIRQQTHEKTLARTITSFTGQFR